MASFKVYHRHLVYLRSATPGRRTESTSCSSPSGQGQGPLSSTAHVAGASLHQDSSVMATDMAVSSREASREGPSQEAGPGAGWPGGAASPGAGGQTQRALSPASRHSSSSAGPPSRRESPPETKSVPSPEGHHHDPPGATEGAVAGQGAGPRGIPATSGSEGSSAGSSAGRSAGRRVPAGQLSDTTARL